MDVKGVLGSVSFDGEWITITKTPAGSRPAPVRLRAADLTGTRLKPGTRLVHGYIQFLQPGTTPARVGGNGRPPYTDPCSLSIPRKSNDAAEKLAAAVEQARR